MKTQEYIDNLEESIKKANHSYRVGNSIMSDEQYDYIVDELKSLKPNSKILNQIGLKPTSRKERLPFNMFSLNKLKDEEQLLGWINSYNLLDEEVILTPKLDGISLLVNEKYHDCWTRGDGFEGQKSNDHFLQIQKLHNNPQDEFTSGEAIILKRDFSYMKDEYKNERNAVAGLY